MTTHALEVRALCKSYGARIALSDVSLCVGTGEIVGVLGPNGAGKTTLVETLTGFRTADSGCVQVLGAAPSDVKRAQKKIGALFQRTALPRYLTVAQLLELFATLYPDYRAADLLVRLLGLEVVLGRLVSELSIGQQQRLAIAIALFGDPELVILDEPTAGLDPIARRAVWNLLLDPAVRNRRSVLLTTHQMDEAEALCDRVYFLKRGEIRGQGAPSELVREVEVTTTLEFGCDEPAVAQLERVFGLESRVEHVGDRCVVRVPSKDLMRSLAALHACTNGSIKDVRIRQDAFEEVYLKVME